MGCSVYFTSLDESFPRSDPLHFLVQELRHYVHHNSFCFWISPSTISTHVMLANTLRKEAERLAGSFRITFVTPESSTFGL